MAKYRCYFLFLLWFSYLIVASILLFTGGFLLSRVTQTTNSTCILYSGNNCNDEKVGVVNGTSDYQITCNDDEKFWLMNNIHEASHICLPKSTKVVLLIVDALRYDFTVYNPTLQNVKPYENKLPIIHELMQLESSSRLYKFIADPPTTTMQRLKALTTGSLPTFIDAGSNFATPEINEDNLIDQLTKLKHDVVFMGDDTWIGLYPKRFVRSYPFPSFNVFDLDTVDNGVVNNLFNELNKKDWSVLIAHFLGVDHCGHRYGPNHPEMTRKLNEMNNVIKDVVMNLDDNTMLFVIGDHGMTNTGDHGGDSEEEVTSAMFVHSKTSLTSFSSHINNNVIKQIDLVPTLATIIGIPIPYSNLGSVVTDSIPTVNKTLTPFADWQLLLFSVWSNVQQITNYIKDYSQTSSTFNTEKLQMIHEKFFILNARVRTISSQNEFEAFAKDAMEYMMLLRNMCEEVWVQFDSFSMSRGLLLCFLTIFFVYMIVDGIPSNRLPEIFMSSFLLCSYTSLLIATGISVVFYYLQFIENLQLTIFFSTGMVSVFMLAMLVIQNWEVIAINWYDTGKTRNWINFISRLVLLLSLCALLSNSYIVEEGSVSLYLLLTLILMILCDNHQSSTKSKTEKNSLLNSKMKWSSVKLKLLLFVLVIGILIRLSVHFWRCREEQRWCIAEYSNNSDSNITTTGKVQYVISLVCLAVFVTATRNWLRNCGNLVGFSPLIVFARYAPTVIVVCIGGFWALHKLPKDTKNKLPSPVQADTLACLVYGIVGFGFLTIVINPLCVYNVPKRKDVVVQNGDNLIPQLFHHVKGLFDRNRSENGESNIPSVYGLATVYSATFVTLSVFACLLFALLLGDSLAPSAVLLYLTAAFVLAVTSISRFEKATNVAQLFEVPNSLILIWMFLSLYFFYGTGHHPTFPNISWEAAFIGTGGTFVHNFIPATLIIINTYGSQMLMGLMLPLLLIAPFTLYVLYPSLTTKKNDMQNEIVRGEILLYDNDNVMLNSAFTMSCKYILYHSIRVFVCMLAATIHCRHLMVWKIFAPKLIFESIGILVTLGSVLLSYLLLVRINFKLEKLFASLNKLHR